MGPSKTKPRSDDPAQSKRFIEAAREAGADETEAGAARAFRKVISQTKRLPAKHSSNRK